MNIFSSGENTLQEMKAEFEVTSLTARSASRGMTFVSGSTMGTGSVLADLIPLGMTI